MTTVAVAAYYLNIPDYHESIGPIETKSEADVIMVQLARTRKLPEIVLWWRRGKQDWVLLTKCFKCGNEVKHYALR